MSDDEPRRLTRDEKRLLGKREARDAERVTKALLDARPEVFARVELEPELRDAVTALRGMFAKKERPRQLRYVQGLLRAADTEAILDSLERASR